MAASSDTARRLLGALEQLAQRETRLLRAGDYAGLTAVHALMAPLVESLGAMARESADDELRERGLRLLERRRLNREKLEGELARARRERQKIRQAGAQLAQWRPAYGVRPAAAGTFSARG